MSPRPPAGRSAPRSATSLRNPLARHQQPLPASAGRDVLGDIMSTAAQTEPRTSNAPDTILSVHNIEVVYDHVILVLKGVSLEVPRGGIVALLGANGAGKTTTLKAISNLLHAERGDVTKGSIVFEGV